MTIITGSRFITNLIARGVVPAETRRVVIEASFDELVRVYVETLGDDSLIDVELPPALVRVPAVRVAEAEETA